MEDLDWYENKHESKEKKRGFEQTEDLDWYKNKHEFKEKKDGVLNKRKIWTDIGISMNLMKKKYGVLDERKIWTDMRISMNRKKKEGVWTNGRFGLIKE